MQGRKFPPMVEPLEDRLVPTGTLAVTDMTGGLAAADLAKTLTGSGVSVSNVSYTGNAVAAGVFSGGADAIGIDSGVVLSTGTATGVIGPQQPGSFTGPHANQPGDANLDSLAGTGTMDAAVLQFDFVPKGNMVTFQYVFGSDEYNAFVGSAYHDEFGIFLNGKDVALVPGTSDPVSINSVNLQTNAPYYINNAGAGDPSPAAGPLRNTQLSGLTVVLTVTASVTAGQTNHVKIAIANTGDHLVDSDVFFKASSLSAETIRTMHPLRYIVSADGKTTQGEVRLQLTTPPSSTGPVTVYLPTLPADVVANASGVTAAGVPYISVPGGFNPSLPEQTIQVPIHFANPLKTPPSALLENFEAIISGP